MAASARDEGNITHGQQELRMRIAVLLFALTLAGGAILVKTGVAPAYRLLLILPFWICCEAFFSSICGTCMVMAAQGRRATRDGAERIASREEIQRMKALARRSQLQSTAASLLVTLPFVLL